MSDKSHVGMGFLVCPVTGYKHSESILLDEQMKKTLDKDNFLGYAYCPEVAEKIADGYVCLIEVKNTNPDDTEAVETKLSLQSADRTGTYVFVKKELAQDMFGIEEADEIQFVSPEVVTFLNDLKAKQEDTDEPAAEKPEV